MLTVHSQERLEYLLTQVADITCSPEECQELIDLLNTYWSPELADTINQFYEARNLNPIPVFLTEPYYWRSEIASIVEIDKNGMIKPETVELQPVSTAHRIHFLRRGWFRYAAAVLVVIGLGTLAYLWTSNKKTNQTLASGNKQLQTDVPPGGDKAVLTLADGSKIILDSAANGNLADQGGVQVVKLANGQIAYDLRGLSGKEVMWNTMSTPKGGQYQVTLPDGTKVWLNAASSITFPTAFTGKERKVKIDGEAYFEVAKNKQQPFLVDIHGESLIQVLGTSFNVNCYQNENVIRTTLVEGSVKVSKGDESQIIKPGQQAVAGATDRQFQILDADIDHTLAWKNGFFNLEESDVYAVMRQLERWYDIKVRYAGSIHNVIFQGQIVRDTNLSDVIELLQEMGVKCRLEGKTLVVL